jgi:hypothetical protein
MNLKFEKNFKRSQCLTAPIPSVMIVEIHFNNQLSLGYDCIILDKSTLADQFPSRASLVGHVHRLIGHVENGPNFDDFSFRLKSIHHFGLILAI